MSKKTSPRIPAVLTGRALTSLRDAGFDLPAALGEPTDNSLEADANNVWLYLDEGRDKRGKKHIHRIVIADDGTGMTEDILQHYLQLGFSTRYMSDQTIGKYGVGAKLAALNFANRIDVWSCDKKGGPWLHAHLDLEELQSQEVAGETPGIDPPTEAHVPIDLANRLPKGTGTVVVWSGIDRLEEGRLAPDAEQLVNDVMKELSRVYRYFLHDGRKIHVNGRSLVPHDPLMLMEDSWSDAVLNKQLATGQQKSPKHFPATNIWDEPIKVGDCTAHIRITLYPEEVTRKSGKGGDALAKELRVPENQGCISFVRLNREVSYTNVPRIFPRGVEDPDRFIGIEVSFKPDLDRFFGIRHVKRGVEPHGELRDRIRDILRKFLPTARKLLEERWDKATSEVQKDGGENAPVATALKDADKTMPKGTAGSDTPQQKKQEILQDLAKDVVGDSEDKSMEREKYLEKIKGLPFVIESISFPGTNFIDVQYIGNQIIIRVNTRHKFYREMWAPMREMASSDPSEVAGADAVKIARRTQEALTLMVVAYAKAESMHEDPHDQYGDLRSYWGQFLDSLLGKVKNVL